MGVATRERLLDAAATLVAERGWGSVTTRAVAERAGVNQALVHYHFGSMETLLREAVLARLESELQSLVDELVDERPFADALLRTMQGLDRFALDTQAGILMAEVLLRSTRDPAVAEAMGDEVRTWRGLLEPRLVLAQARGTVRDDIDAASLAMVVAAALDGLLLQRMADPALDPAHAAAVLMRLIAPPSEDPA
jgi:AcrR family transcriptional regulator